VFLEAAEADEPDEIIGALPHRRLVEPLLHLHAVPHVARNRAPRQQAGILEHERPIRAGPVHLLAIDRHAAVLVRQQAGHDVDQRRLAAAARADDREEFALVDGQADVVYSECLRRFAFQPVPFGQVLDVKFNGHLPVISRRPAEPSAPVPL
jgi:hypothetical protein